jgi:hypothetical protein
MGIDPVHQENGQWYFWDETWAESIGPYPTEQECREALVGYVAYLNSSSRTEG